MKLHNTIITIALSALLTAACSESADQPAFTPHAQTVFGQTMLASGLVGSIHEDSSNTVVNGLQESYIRYIAPTGEVIRLYMYEVDPTMVNLKVCTANNLTDGTFALQRLTQQAAFIETQGKKVLAAVNGDLYNAKGRPNGVLVIDGNTIKNPNARSSNTYFALTHANQAIIGMEADLAAVPNNDIKYAIGGKDLLLRNGELTPIGSVKKEAQTAVGFKADGKVVLLVVDGGLTHYSNGMTLADMAVFLKHVNCEQAISLSPNKSCTVVTRRNDHLILKNIPSNNMQEEAIANGLIITEK